MSIINNIFDIVFVINLSSEKFKKKMMTIKLNKANIKFKFIEAVNGYEEPYFNRFNEYKNKSYDWEGAHIYEKTRQKKMIPSAGAYGYLESWLKILYIAKEKKYKKIFVFDDDIILDDDFENKVKLYFQNIKYNFKLISLGVSQHVWGKIVFENTYYNPIEFTDGSFAVGINSSIYDELIIEIKKYNIAFDSGALRYIYKKYKKECYIGYPNLVIADVTTSSIGGDRNMFDISNKFRWHLEKFNYVPYCNVLVSVILPIYNAEDTIELSIQSILNQTYHNIELIIIDDASTDSTLNVVYKTVRELDNVKVIELKKNMGCYFAKNIGIKISSGKYITFQDADDISLLNRIELQMKEILENKYDIVGSDIIRSNNIITTLDVSIQDLLYNHKQRFGLITLLFKKEVFEINGYFRDDYSHSMDQEFIERLFYNNNNELSEVNCHTLMDKNKFPKFKKIKKALYICQPMKDTNVSIINNRGMKNHVRKLYLEDISNNKKINYRVCMELIDYISKNYESIKFNNAEKLFYLKYFTTSTSKILEINPIEPTNNDILITDLYNINYVKSHIITINLDVKNTLNKLNYIVNYIPDYSPLGVSGSAYNLDINKKQGMHKFIIDNKIDQFLVSDAIKDNNNPFKEYIDVEYKCKTKNTIFYGVYKFKDINNIKNHSGKKWIMWAGNDCNTSICKRIQIVLDIANLNIEKHLCINSDVSKYLTELKINHFYIFDNKITYNFFDKINIIKNNLINKYVNKIFLDISKIFIINLKRRQDRFNFMKFKLNEIGIYNYDIFEAVDAKNDSEVNNLFNNYNKTLIKTDYVFSKRPYINQKSSFAIILTYKNLIKRILDMNLNDNDYILILQDDILFHNNINNYKLILDKDVIYLGGNQLNWDKKYTDDYKLINNNKYITYGAYSIIYKISFLKIFYNKLSDITKIRKPYDYMLWDFIVKNNSTNKVIYPNIVIPNLSDSDNMGPRNIFEIASAKKWNLTNYNYLNLESKFYDLYNDVYNNKISLRKIDKYIDSVSYKDVSRIIEGKNKSFVFIIASFNNQPYYTKNLDSVLNQTYKLWRIIYIDDASTDNTFNLVTEYIKIHKLENKCTILKNEKNMKQGYSRYKAYPYCDDDEIICFLDGDDWLYDNKVLEKLNEEYQFDIKLTYGSYYNYENDKLNSFIKSNKYNNNVMNSETFREMKGWYGIPLRTGYAKLYKNMPKDYMFDHLGNWMSACTDLAEFFWAIEESKGKFKNINYPTYVYNIDASKRFRNSMSNLSKEQYQYRYLNSEKIFNYNIKKKNCNLQLNHNN